MFVVDLLFKYRLLVVVEKLGIEDFVYIDKVRKRLKGRSNCVSFFWLWVEGVFVGLFFLCKVGYRV